MMKGALNILVFLTLILTALHDVSGQNLYEVSPLDINTDGKELAPSLFNGSLVFSSDRRNEVFVKYTDLNGEPLTDLYISSRKDNGKFTNPKLFSKNLTSKFFEGPAAFSSDGRTVYFTKNIEGSYDRKEQPVMTFGIFVSELKDGEWTKPVAFPYNGNNCNTGYPCVSDDGQTMLFCSDDSAGFGGFDIYLSRLEDGRWTTPQNLGNAVNTDKNEVFPFLHKSGRLYFASRGHNGRGDMDLYYTRETSEGWLKPVPMQEPFNSESDDYGLIMNNKMDTAFFVTDRLSSPDIFMALLSVPVFNDCQEQEENNYCYVFYESNNSEMDTTAFAYEWDFGDSSKARAIQAEHCYQAPGVYDVELNVIDKLTGEQFFSQASYTLEVEKIEQPYILVSASAPEGEKLLFDASESYYRDIKIDNYYWNFGDGSMAVAEKAEHIYEAPGVYTVILGVTGMDGNGVLLNECVSHKVTVIKADDKN